MTMWVCKDNKGDLYLSVYPLLKRTYDDGHFEWEPVVNHSFDTNNIVKLNEILKEFNYLKHEDEPIEVVILSKRKEMTREEWKEVIGKAQEAAFNEYYKTIDADENLKLIFTLLNYIHDAL